MKESLTISQLLDLDYVEKKEHGSVLELHKDGIIVSISIDNDRLKITIRGNKDDEC